MIEQDDKTKTLEVIIEGKDLSFEKIKELIDNLGGSVHSLDQVSAGERIVGYLPRKKGGG